MTWMLDERARPIPVRADRAGSLESLPSSRLVREVVPVVPRESDAGAPAWLTAASESEAHLCPAPAGRGVRRLRAAASAFEGVLGAVLRAGGLA